MYKEKLLETGIFKDNIYLEKYLDLINKNLDTKRESFKTQKHHVIPKYYYEYNGIPINNDNENCVNLLYKDHMLAHYYLALCSINENLAYKNYCSLRFIENNSNFIKSSNYIDEITLIKNLDNYQYLYEESRKYVGKISSEKNKGKIRTEEQKKKYSKAKKGIKQSEVHKQHNREAQLDTVWVHNLTIEKRIKKQDLDCFISNGWTKGRLKFSNTHKLKISEKLSGRIIKDSARENMRKARLGHSGYNTGMRWYTDGKKEIMCLSNDCPDGFKRGRL